MYKLLIWHQVYVHPAPNETSYFFTNNKNIEKWIYVYVDMFLSLQNKYKTFLIFKQFRV